MADERELLASSKAWPVTEALRLLERVRRAPAGQGLRPVRDRLRPLGPAAYRHLRRGVPHHAGAPGLRRASPTCRPSSTPSPTTWTACARCRTTSRTRRWWREHLGRPLTAIPDPFGTHESYGAAHERAAAARSSTGSASPTPSRAAPRRTARAPSTRRCCKVLERHDAIREVVLPTLGPERRATYSPILPISPRTGRVLQVPIEECRPEHGTVVFRDEDGTLTEVPVTDGHCKMQWKCDWALRWAALDVDYEMSGKDLIDSVKPRPRSAACSTACRPRASPTSCSSTSRARRSASRKGNGLTIEEWLRYGTPREPAALPLPRAAEGQAAALRRDPAQRRRLLSASSTPSRASRRPSRSATRSGTSTTAGRRSTTACRRASPSACSSTSPASPTPRTPDVLWGFIARYAPGTTPETSPRLAALVEHAIAYYRDFVRPTRSYRAPTAQERAALDELRAWLARRRRGRRRRGDPVRALRDRQAPRLRQPARLVQGPLRGAAGPERGPALRLLRRRSTASPTRRTLIEQALDPRGGGGMSGAPTGGTAPRDGDARRASPAASPAPRAPGHARAAARRAQAAAPARDQRPPRGAGRARPRARAGPPPVRRDLPGPPAARAARRPRPRLRAPPGHHRACAAWARSTTPCCRCCATGRRSCTRHQHAAPGCRPAPVPVHAAARRRRRDGAPRRRRAHAARSRCSTPCCASSRPRAQRSSRARTPPRLNTPQLAAGTAGPRPTARSQARAIAEAHQTEPPLDLSVTRDPERWAAELGAEILPTGTLRRRSGGLVDALPGYDEGAWWVQDAAAALPALLMGQLKGRRVLDIGAAPGGKTAQLCVAGCQGHRRSSARRGGPSSWSATSAAWTLDAEIVVADALEWQAPEPVRRRPARRALHRHRHHPPPPRRPLGQVAGGRGPPGRGAGSAARGRGRA